MFLYRSPREYIEGYTDPLIAGMAQIPLYAGGDISNSPIMTINSAPTGPPHNPIAFFEGTDDYMYTRTYALWLNRTNISIKRKDYTDIYTVADVYDNPWSQEIPINGTDGM